MQMALAVVGSIVAALLETSVAPFVMIGGVRPDLVMVSAVAVVVTVSAEAGFVWAFCGGLILDVLSAPAHPMGASVVALVLTAGLAAVLARFAGRNRVVTAILATLPLTFVYQLAFGLLVAAALGEPSLAGSTGPLVPSAIENAVLAVPLALAGRWMWLRWGAQDRIEW